MHGLDLKGLSDVAAGHVLELLLLGVWHFCGQKTRKKNNPRSEPARSSGLADAEQRGSDTKGNPGAQHDET